jgi:DNA primase
MSLIPDETIQQVLAATDIVELIGRYVTLRRAGGSYQGLCPFHTEKTPSFNVTPTRQRYYCFGCGANGHAIKFIQEQEGMTFIEALKRLATASGIVIQEGVWDANAEREAKQRSALKHMHEEIAQWYHELLLKHPMADAARQYLKSRAVSSDIAKNWQLGYAPDNVQPLRTWAMEKKYSSDFLIQGGIMKLADDGRPYPGFRHRLMFPIRNENGEVIAFSGRLLDPTAKTAKYLNSPETVLFSKSKVLFGFDKSRRAMKTGQAIICEGQIDMIMAYEHGIQNICAPLGTAFTEFHAKLLKRHVDEVVLCFDADNAGFKAAERAFQILTPAGLLVKVAVLPKGEDPDSLIRGQGPEVFNEIISKAQAFLDFQIAHKRAAVGGGEMRNQINLIEQTASTIALDPSVAARDLMIRGHANSLGISEDALRKEVQSFIRRQQRSAEQKGKQANIQPTQPPPRNVAEDGKRLLLGQHRSARFLCQLALNSAPVMTWLRTVDIEPILQQLPGTEMLGRIWNATFPGGDNIAISAFLMSLPAEEESAFGHLLAQSMPKIEAVDQVTQATDSWHSLDLARLQHQVRQAQAAMRDPSLSPERIGQIHSLLMSWQKEYLDRTRGEQDSR